MYSRLGKIYVPESAMRRIRASYNYASGRLDHQVYRKAIDIERETIEADILMPMYEAWEERDRLLHYEDYRAAEDVGPTVMWDGWEHVDPGAGGGPSAPRRPFKHIRLFFGHRRGEDGEGDPLRVLPFPASCGLPLGAVPHPPYPASSVEPHPSFSPLCRFCAILCRAYCLDLQ